MKLSRAIPDLTNFRKGLSRMNRDIVGGSDTVFIPSSLSVGESGHENKSNTL